MQAFEYKVVPAPTKGIKAKGAKTHQDRFAHALQLLMNRLGADGWEYQRADTLPCEEREGLMGKTTVFQHMLVFRRAVQAASATPDPVITPLQQPPLLEKPAAPASPAPPVSTASQEVKTEQVAAE